jgi:hypothetical protein
MQPDGLNMRKVNKLFGGQQPKMRPSKLEDKSCFGPYHTKAFKLQLGGTQNMVFGPTDTGPFYFNAVQREIRRFDEKTGKMIKKSYTKDKIDTDVEGYEYPQPHRSINIDNLRFNCFTLRKDSVLVKVFDTKEDPKGEKTCQRIIIQTL